MAIKVRNQPVEKWKKIRWWENVRGVTLHKRFWLRHLVLLDFLHPVVLELVRSGNVLLRPLHVLLSVPAAHHHNVLSLLFVLKKKKKRIIFGIGTMIKCSITSKNFYIIYYSPEPDQQALYGGTLTSWYW